MPSDPSVIYTDRLRLVPMSPAFLQALSEDDWARASEIGGFTVTDEILVPRWVLESRRCMLTENPALQPWLLRCIVHAESNTMIGDIGFHADPGADHLLEYGEDGVELGYSIHTSHRRCGYAREALRGMMHWARTTHGVRTFVLSISPENVASLGLALSLEFRKVGTHVDLLDGPEDIYLSRLP